MDDVLRPTTSSDPPDRPPVGIRWLGHATVQIDLAGIRILTDPALTPRLAHLRRHHLVRTTTIDRPDVILVSHVHMDHLHLPSLRTFGRDVPIVVPSGAGAFVARHGFRAVVETRSGSTTHFGPVTIEAVAAVHRRTRWPGNPLRADPLGFVLRAGGTSVYFPGDTAPFEAMSSWGPVDVALLPIWGWGRSLGPGHLDPATVAHAVELLRPRLVVPIHWGTYSPIVPRRPGWLDIPPQRFRTELASRGADDLLTVLTPGDGTTLPAEAAHDRPGVER